MSKFIAGQRNNAESDSSISFQPHIPNVTTNVASNKGLFGTFELGKTPYFQEKERALVRLFLICHFGN